MRLITSVQDQAQERECHHRLAQVSGSILRELHRLPQDSASLQAATGSDRGRERECRGWRRRLRTRSRRLPLRRQPTGRRLSRLSPLQRQKSLGRGRSSPIEKCLYQARRKSFRGSPEFGQDHRKSQSGVHGSKLGLEVLIFRGIWLRRFVLSSYCKWIIIENTITKLW